MQGTSDSPSPETVEGTAVPTTEPERMEEPEVHAEEDIRVDATEDAEAIIPERLPSLAEAPVVVVTNEIGVDQVPSSQTPQQLQGEEEELPQRSPADLRLVGHRRLGAEERILNVGADAPTTVASLSEDLGTINSDEEMEAVKDSHAEEEGQSEHLGVTTQEAPPHPPSTEYPQATTAEDATPPLSAPQPQPAPVPNPNATTAAKRPPPAAAWTLDFSSPAKRTKRKTTQKERDAINDSHWRRAAAASAAAGLAGTTEREGCNSAPEVAPSDAIKGEGISGDRMPQADSEGNTTALPVVSLDGLADRDALVPTNLVTSTRDALQRRLCFRLPRLLCVNKQYPRSCGVSSLTSIYNYLYSWLGETPSQATTPPVSQEELMTILGFEPPFGEIPWGSFTGNTTLIRWFYALNRHFKRPRGRAYILYKAHGHGKTTHLFNNDNQAILAEVKKCLDNPQCALIYHCHNHYMCPIGYQDIPVAQTDFLKPDVPTESCDTTLFIGEVSRGRHEALYARKWSEIVKDIECQSPHFFNIRHPELGIQTRTKAGAEAKKAKKAGAKGKKAAAPSPSEAEGMPLGTTHALEHAKAGPAEAAAVDLGSIPVAATDPITGEPLAKEQMPPGGTDVTDNQRDFHGAPSIAAPTTATAPDNAVPTGETAPAPAHETGDHDAPLPQALPTTTTTATAAVAGKKREGGNNLHCLICFRTDEEEVNPALYEHLSAHGNGDRDAFDEDDEDDEEVLEERRAMNRKGRANSSSDDDVA